jgi:probable F420-dependent oxidoreductase
MTPPTLTVGLPNFGTWFAGAGWRGLVDLARAAEDAGIDRVVVVDHVVMGPNTDAYAWGRFPQPPDAPWLEPLTVLAAMAAATTRVRLATGILIAPLRPAVLLAKAAATLDVLSGGRLDLGVGTGWQREEYDAAGVDFSRRGQLLTDTIAAMKVLWRDGPADFTSPTVSFRTIWCEPKPLQPGGVPVWVAGTLHPRAVARIAHHADGWIPIMGASLDDVADGARRLREALVACGRDPGAFGVQAPLRYRRGPDGRLDLARSMESVPALAAAGATDVHVTLQAFCPGPEAAPAVLTELARRFRDAVAPVAGP